MKKVGVTVFFDHRDSYVHGDLRIPEDGFFSLTHFFFDENITSEEFVGKLIQEGRLLPLDDPRLRYNLVLQAFEAYYRDFDGHSPHPPRSLSKPVILREGQTLASTHLTHLVMNESEIKLLQRGVPYRELFCSTSIEIQDSPPPKGHSSTISSGWSEVLTTAGDFIIKTATVASIIGGLDIIERRWREKRITHSIYSQRDASSPPESEIVAIRLQMTDGTEAIFQEWLTDPARLKHYIDIFLQPSISAKPVEAVFALKSGKSIIVDVSEGAQNNLQLNELLSYLNIEPT